MTEQTTPDPAHIDAIARKALVGDPWTDLPNSIARAILETPDPAVHAAMLDALTRHGVLKEVTTHGPVWSERPRTARDGGLVLDDNPVRYISGWQLNRRLVTPWEVAP